nr:hypothetical protein [Burkholderia sp. S171]
MYFVSIPMNIWLFGTMKFPVESKAWIGAGFIAQSGRTGASRPDSMSSITEKSGSKAMPAAVIATARQA